MAYNVEDIAKLLLSWADYDNEPMSNMKLQKMLYYQQGFHLAYFGTPLFEDEVEAWMYGPVVPKIYYKYESFGKSPIPGEADFDIDMDDETEYKLFWEVYSVYSQFTATGLMQKTHGEMPWSTTEVGKGNVISKEKMRTFFKTKLASW